MLAKALQLAAAGNASIAWPDISTASHVRFDTINNGTNDIYGLFFKPDGTKVYTVEITTDSIIETTLSTPWDISTHGSADYTLTTNQTNNTAPSGLFFKKNGEEMYVIDTVDDTVCQYSLTTGWDLSTASYTRNFSVASQETTPRDVSFSPDGLNMYVVGWSSDKIHRYTLTTAWDISTASHDSSSALLTDLFTPSGVFLKEDGTRIYSVGRNRQRIEQYNLSTPYDLSTGTFTTADSTLSVSSEETLPYVVFISPDGSHLYLGGGTGHGVDQYSLG